MTVHWDGRISLSDRRSIEQDMKAFNKDTVVKCFTCGKLIFVNMADSLKHGWTSCCRGHTMTLIYSTADVEREVGHLLTRAVKSAIEKGLNE